MFVKLLFCSFYTFLELYIASRTRRTETHTYTPPRVYLKRHLFQSCSYNSVEIDKHNEKKKPKTFSQYFLIFIHPFSMKILLFAQRKWQLRAQTTAIFVKLNVCLLFLLLLHLENREAMPFLFYDSAGDKV